MRRDRCRRDNFITIEKRAAVHRDLPRETRDGLDVNDDQRLDFAEYHSLEAQNTVARYSGS